MSSVRPLDAKWTAYIKAHVDWVNGWIVPGREEKFKTPEGKLSLIQQIIDSHQVAVTETLHLQCLGTYFGTAVVEHTKWPFAVFEDDQGTSLCIEIPGKSARIFPVTIISKRYERGESVNVFHLFTSVIGHVNTKW